MSWQASSWALKQRVGDPILKILLLAVANYADPEGRCWPKVETLSFDSEVSKRTIQRKLAELQELGFIEVSARFDAGGKQTSSLIQLRMDEGCQKVTPEICHGEGDTKVSPPNDFNNHKNKQSTSASKKKDDGAYSEDFEALWKLAAELGAPRTKNTSKKKAWDLYRMLNTERREIVRNAIPIFAAAMRSEGRPEDKIKHFQFFLSERIYETVGVSAATGGDAPVKTYKDATREEWQKVLNVWAIDSHWRSTWGPEPGKPGCAVPEDLMAAHNVKHRGFMFSDEEIERFKKIAGSQNRVPGNAGKSST